jgi:hypothetical protein
MKRIFSAKSLVAAAIALGAVVAASAAHARSDLIVSIGLNVPQAHVQPAPVYSPRPVHVQPRPVYVQPQPVYRGQPRYAQRSGAWSDYDRDGVPNIRDRDSRFYDARVAHRHGSWDADRDGVPNRYDRAPGNPYRR